MIERRCACGTVYYAHTWPWERDTAPNKGPAKRQKKRKCFRRIFCYLYTIIWRWLYQPTYYHLRQRADDRFLFSFQKLYGLVRQNNVQFLFLCPSGLLFLFFPFFLFFLIRWEKNEVPVRVDCLSHYCLALDFEFVFFFLFFFFIKRPFRMDSLTDSTVLVGLSSSGYM